MNEYAAEVVRSAPDRFGFFATLCLPDLDGSVVELEHALDRLGADGVVLLANSRGVYLGDRVLDPLFDELDRRHARVFVHPSHLHGVEPLRGMPPFVADFLLDTTRAAIRLAGSGTLERCPNVEIILSHAGGFVPYAAHRFAAFASPRRDPADGIEQLRKFYFDTALSGSPTAFPSLLAFAAPGHVLFGCDWPYAPDASVAYFTRMYESHIADGEARASIDRKAAEATLPSTPAGRRELVSDRTRRAARTGLLLTAVVGGALGCGGDSTQSAPADARAPAIEVLTSGIDASLRGLSVIDDQVAWASGADGQVGITTDGGATWRFARVPGHEDRDFRDVEAFSATRALIVAAGAPGLILETTDAGATWNHRFRDDRPEVFLDAIGCLDQRRCLVLGDPIDGRFLLVASEDGGASWVERAGPEALPGEAAFAASGTAIVIDRHGWIAIGTGGGAQARVLRSSDFGRDWLAETVPIAAGAPSRGVFSLTPAARGGGADWVAVGGDHQAPADTAGTAARRHASSDGSPWQAAAPPPSGYRSAIERLAGGRLIATGPNGTDLSDDDGASWKPHGATGYHVVRRAGRGSLVLFAGEGGRLGRLRP